MAIKPGVNTFCEISRNPLYVILPNFQGFLGSTDDLESVKISELTKGFWGSGWGRKKFDPHISPIWGSGKPNLLFPWGFRQGLPCCQNLRGYPLRGLPPEIRDCFKKFWEVGTWTRGFEGVALVRMSQKNFWGFRTKRPPDIFFIFSNFDPGAELCPLKKLSNFWRILTKNSRRPNMKVEGLGWIKI